MRKEKEFLWRTNKYEALMYDERQYRHIQKRVNTMTYQALEEALIQLYESTPTIGSVANTYEHMWGYFKKIASEEEKQEAFFLLKQYKCEMIEREALWQYLATLAVKYNVVYLQETTLLRRYIKKEEENG